MDLTSNNQKLFEKILNCLNLGTPYSIFGVPYLIGMEAFENLAEQRGIHILKKPQVTWNVFLHEEDNQHLNFDYLVNFPEIEGVTFTLCFMYAGSERDFKQGKKQPFFMPSEFAVMNPCWNFRIWTQACQICLPYSRLYKLGWKPRPL